MKDIAFLIEGGTAPDEELSLYLVDIKLTRYLAEKNNLLVFDPILSYTSEQMQEFYRKFQGEERQLITAFRIWSDTFDKGKNILMEVSQEKLNELLKEPYPKDEGPIPVWLLELKPQDTDNFVKKVIDNYFAGDKEAYENHSKKLFDEFINLTNEQSKNKTIEYLKEHKEVATVLGLIGKKHLPMLKVLGEVVSESEKSCHVKLTLEGREINLYLFGDKHGSLEHYKAFVEKMKELKLITESEKEPEQSVKTNSSYSDMFQTLKVNVKNNEVKKKGFDPFASDDDDAKQETEQVSSRNPFEF